MLYADQMMTNIQTLGNDCQTNYESVFGFTTEDATSMCSSKNFDFSDAFGTCYNLVNLYYYNDTFPVDNYAMVYEQTSWSESQFDQYIFSDSSTFSTYFLGTIVQNVYTHY